MNNRTIKDLRVEEIYEAAAQLAHSEVGRQACRKRGILEPGEARRQLRLVEDALALLKEGYEVDFSEYTPWEKLLLRASKQGILMPAELIGLARMLAEVRDAREVIRAGRLRAPTLYEAFGELPELDDLIELIEETFDEKGLIRDDASPRLGPLRKRVKALRDEIHERLDALLKDVPVRSALQDEFVTLREGRYVLPVQVSHTPEIPGIIHGMSNTGQTAFVEPEVIVTLNNKLVVAQEEVRLEELRVLRSRTRALMRRSEEVKRSLEAIEELDWIFARARLARRLNAQYPKLGGDSLKLVDARHPLLVLSALKKGTTVIPNTIQLPPQKRVMVISGPNAGGKSITLQTIGLCVLMAYSGYLIPAGPGSTIPNYDDLFTLMGDPSTLREEVSTFTGQLARVKEIFDAAKQRKVLALLDEVATGTEPKKGQALAAAIVKSLADMGVDTFVATHYELVKRIADEDERFVNAGMLTDDRGRPTYRLVLGRVGESNPFEAAKEVGFPEEVLELARSFVSEKELKLEEALSEVSALRDALRREKEEVERLKKRLEELKERYTKALEEVRAKANVMVAQARREALEEVRRIRAELENMRREAKGMGTIRRRKKRLDEIEDVLVKRIEAEEPQKARKPEEVFVGDRVQVEGMEGEGVVKGLDPKRGKVEVVIRGIRLWVEAGKVHRVGGEEGKEEVRQEEGEKQHLDLEDELEIDPKYVVDIRGMRVDEAIPRVEKALDEAYIKEWPYLVIRHGIGTSALKKAVRGYLRESGYPVRFRGGFPSEGGEGVTIVVFV